MHVVPRRSSAKAERGLPWCTDMCAQMHKAATADNVIEQSFSASPLGLVGHGTSISASAAPGSRSALSVRNLIIIIQLNLTLLASRVFSHPYLNPADVSLHSLPLLRQPPSRSMYVHAAHRQVLAGTPETVPAGSRANPIPPPRSCRLASHSVLPVCLVPPACVLSTRLP